MPVHRDPPGWSILEPETVERERQSRDQRIEIDRDPKGGHRWRHQWRHWGSERRRQPPFAEVRSTAPVPLWFSARHDDAYETAKWEKITYAGIVTCTILSIYKPIHGPFRPPAYGYLHIRSKEFTWGLNGRFQKKRHSKH